MALLDYLIASRAGVKLSTSRSFNRANDRYLRMILMQSEVAMEEVFRRLGNIGVSYAMQLPAGLASEYDVFLESLGWPEDFVA